jgi:hypothetical protein
MQYQVRLIPSHRGKGQTQPYCKVEAETAKDAAEQLYGSPLSVSGQSYQLRALVHPLRWPRGAPMLFYAQ